MGMLWNKTRGSSDRTGEPQKGNKIRRILVTVQISWEKHSFKTILNYHHLPLNRRILHIGFLLFASEISTTLLPLWQPEMPTDIQTIHVFCEQNSLFTLSLKIYMLENKGLCWERMRNKPRDIDWVQIGKNFQYQVNSFVLSFCEIEAFIFFLHGSDMIFMFYEDLLTFVTFPWHA